MLRVNLKNHKAIYAWKKTQPETIVHQSKKTTETWKPNVKTKKQPARHAMTTSEDVRYSNKEQKYDKTRSFHTPTLPYGSSQFYYSLSRTSLDRQLICPPRTTNHIYIFNGYPGRQLKYRVGIGKSVYALMVISILLLKKGVHLGHSTD